MQHLGVCFLAALLFPVSTAELLYSPQQHYSIGIWTSSSVDKLIRDFSPLFETHLSNEVGALYDPPLTFEIIPMDTNGSNGADTLWKQGRLDFAYHSGAGIACIESQFGFSTLATQYQAVQGHEVPCYGSLIFSLKSNHAITEVEDFKMKRLGVGYPEESGSFLLGAQVIFYMNDYQGMIDDIIAGRIDVGMLDSGWIEDNAPEAVSKLRYHNVINATYRGEPYPFPTTTSLVPNFGFSAAPYIPLLLQNQIYNALSSFNTSNPAAPLADVVTFGLPASYESARILLRKLGLLKETPDGDSKCLDMFQAGGEIITCPVGYAKEKGPALQSGCKGRGLPCPEGRPCFCRPCHPDTAVNIFPWQMVLGLCCALFAVGLCFSVGWVALLQGEDLVSDVIVTHRKLKEKFSAAKHTNRYNSDIIPV